MERAWLREFNSMGLQLRPQAAKLVTSFLRASENPHEMVEALVEHTKLYLRTRQGVVDAFIDADVIQAVIQVMHDAKEESKEQGGITTHEAAMLGVQHLDLGDGIEIYSALGDVQPFRYDRAGKAWVPSLPKPKLFANSDAKSKIYADRYSLLWHRLLMEGEYVPEALANENPLQQTQRKITPVESLVGNPGRKLTFGLLSREYDSTGKNSWAIEDLHKRYPVELEVQFSDNLITDSCFVLAEGQLFGDSFHIQRIDVPGAVSRAASNENDEVPTAMFGGSRTREQICALERSEQHNQEGMYVVLSEVHLDNIRTLERLADLFQGYEAAGPPVAYIFMGSFCSSAFIPTQAGVQNYCDGFERLKFMMRNLPEHVTRRTKFIFIPGPNDPGSATLPRAPLAEYLTSDLAKEIPGVIMATNPCRIRHFSRELVFFRHDVLRLLRRHEVVPLRGPQGDAPTPQQVREEMVRLLFDQAHLVPLPLEESNILWAFDHTLRLYPMPDAVFIGGVSQHFDCKYEGAQFCSVGPFHRDASFYAYHPIKEVLEPCDVPDPAA